jgi:pyruvate dehydrogenase E1 component
MNSPLSPDLLAPGAGIAGRDIDPQETQEWRDAFEAVTAVHGKRRAAFILDELCALADRHRVGWRPAAGSSYVNTIPVERQPDFPGDLSLEERLGALMRWNALAMVVRANAAYGELGGHIASYASAADLFEVGFNHFFRAGTGGDLVFLQPHSAPGVYARAFLEGRLDENDLTHFRQEVLAARTGARGLSS